MSETPETESPEPTYDRVEHYKAMAETILATSTRTRERCNESAASALAGLRHDFPEVTDETMFLILAELGMMIAMISRLPAGTISDTLDTMFSNVTLAAAHVIGAYDLGDTESAMRDLDEILKARRKAREDETPDTPDTGPVPGMYL